MSAMASSQRRSRAWLYTLAIALLLGAWLTAAFTHLDFWAYEDDEGTFLVTAPPCSTGTPSIAMCG